MFIETIKGTGVIMFCRSDCTWCPKEIEILEKIEQEGMIKAFKIDISKGSPMRSVAGDLGLKYLPSMLLVNDGQLVSIDDPRFNSEYLLHQYHTEEQLRRLLDFNKDLWSKDRKFMELVFFEFCGCCKSFSKDCYCSRHKVRPMSRDWCKKFQKREKFCIYYV